MDKISKSGLVKLQKQFGTDEAIGKKLKLTRQAVHQLRKNYGIESTYTGHPKRNEQMIALYKKGTSGIKIAKKFGMSFGHTYRIIKEAVALKKKKAPAKKKK
jgi:Mor family transcriptional regulator